MGDTEKTPPTVCDECRNADSTVRDLGLRTRYALCDACFDDLVATRTLAGPLPLSRILHDMAAGREAARDHRQDHA